MIIDELKKQLQTSQQLQNISQAFEQSAALYLFKTKSKILHSRDFFEESWKTYDIVRQVASQKNVSDKKLIIAITPDEGMCGNLLWQEIEQVELALKGRKTELLVIGKKGKAHFTRDVNSTIQFFDLPADFSLRDINKIADIINKYGLVSIIYPKYLSAFEQKIVTVKLNDPEDINNQKRETVATKQYLFDPGVEQVGEYFSKAMVSLLIYRYVSESMLAYKAAQMIAMKRAYDNARDQVTETKSKYFRIHREIIDGAMRELSASRNLWEAK